jgi:hypothetical protein
LATPSVQLDNRALRNGRDILRKTKADARLRRIFAEPLSLDFWVRVQLAPKQLPL